MPSPQPVLAASEAARVAADRGFTPPRTDGRRSSAVDGRVGIEMEWCTVDLVDPTRPADFAAVRDAARSAHLPNGSRVTYEPGGQIELSTPAVPGLAVIPAAALDAAGLRDALARRGIGMVAIGLEPGPPRARFLESPRYEAMEAYFDACGDAGRTMMRSTAALQLNLDLGRGPEIERRWDLTHALGPVLAATFANSPFWNATPSGWKSTRLAVWQRVDPSRTLPVANGIGCRDAWAKYALSAGLMLIRCSDQEHVAVTPGLTFADWIEHGHPAGWPTVEDLEYHLTTLFPPVRPRGWFEVRMLDALPTPWWRVAVAVGTVLIYDRDAAATARDAIAEVRDRWVDAARVGLADPMLADAARTCFAAARPALERHHADPTTLEAVAEFEERFVARGRCPADDLLDVFASDGRFVPSVDGA
jgi:glutamate--cysteine ligase